MPAIHHPMFDDAANIKGRLRVADEFPRREDIHKHAATLIDLQHGAIGVADIELEPKERALGRYIGRVISDPDYAEDEKAPTGIKLPPLYFSPLFHLERAQRRRSSGGSYAMYLPRTIEELEEHLHETMWGVFRNGDEEQEVLLDKMANGVIEVDTRAASAVQGQGTYSTIIEEPEFEELTGVTLRSLAEFLSAIRMTHPALFLLLLSFEIDEARRTMPCLDDIGWPNEAGEWRKTHFKKAKCTILAIFEIVRILRRGTAIVNALTAKSQFTVSEVRRVVARLRNGVRTPADKKTLQAICISTYGLRKIALSDIDRHHAVLRDPKRRVFRRRLSDEGTLLSFMTCVMGSDTVYAADVVQASLDNIVLNLPAAGPPPPTPLKCSDTGVVRIPGAGKNQQDELSTFYGYRPRDIAIVTAVEAMAVFGQGRSTRLTARLASLIDRKLSKGEKAVRSDQVVPVRKTIDRVFPVQGEFRHSCGFARSSWTDLEEDVVQWRALAESTNAITPGDSYAAVFLATRRYLHGFSYGITRMAKLDESARIFCHLSHAMGPLAQDPIWIRLLDRAKFIAGINARNTSANNDRGAVFGSGPKNLEQLVRSIR